MRAPRGICPVCGKEYALRRDGTMGAHGFRQDVWNGPRGYCDGEGKRPKEIVVSSPSSEPKRLTPSQQILRFFEWKHLPKNLQPISQQFQLTAIWMESNLPDGPEKTVGLRKLLEAKDCAVRAKL